MIVPNEIPKPVGLPQPGILLNLAGLQAGWMACVLGAATEHPWAGTWLAVLIAVAHMLRAADPGHELKLALATAALALLWNGLLLATGLLAFPADGIAEWIAPAWTLALGPLLATTFNGALRDVRHRPWRAALLGSVFAPLAYVAGDQAGAVILPYPEIAVGLLGLGGMVLLPLLLWLARRWDGVNPAPAV